MRCIERVVAVAALAVVCVTGPSLALAGSDSPIPGMSQDDLIKLALSAAPPAIARNAAVRLPGPDGELVEVRTGSNGFVCIPDLSGLKKPDPVCGDAASWQWAEAFMSGAPAPANSVPGIAYMGRGGWHYEKAGRILLNDEPGAKAVAEPPHWMMFWPVGSHDSGLPDMPAKFGTYVMFDGTPYAHLMIEQDPARIK